MPEFPPLEDNTEFFSKIFPGSRRFIRLGEGAESAVENRPTEGMRSHIQPTDSAPRQDDSTPNQADRAQSQPPTAWAFFSSNFPPSGSNARDVPAAFSPFPALSLRSPSSAVKDRTPGLPVASLLNPADSALHGHMPAPDGYVGAHYPYPYQYEPPHFPPPHIPEMGSMDPMQQAYYHRASNPSDLDMYSYATRRQPVPPYPHPSMYAEQPYHTAPVPLPGHYLPPYATPYLPSYYAAASYAPAIPQRIFTPQLSGPAGAAAPTAATAEMLPPLAKRQRKHRQKRTEPLVREMPSRTRGAKREHKKSFEEEWLSDGEVEELLQAEEEEVSESSEEEEEALSEEEDDNSKSWTQEQQTASTKPKPKPPAKKFALGDLPWALSPGLTVMNLGEIPADRPKYHNRQYISPIGFKARRTITIGGKASPFIAEVQDGGDIPIYNVYLESQPEISSSSPSCSRACLDGIKAAGSDRTSVSGPDFFGWRHPAVRRGIEELPNFNTCTEYRPELRKLIMKKKQVNNGKKAPNSKKKAKNVVDSDTEELLSDDEEPLSDPIEKEVDTSPSDTRLRKRSLKLQLELSESSEEDRPRPKQKPSKKPRPVAKESKKKYDLSSLMLPREVGQGITLLSLGEIVHDRPAYHTQQYIFPIGFKTQRRLAAGVTYVSEILEGGIAPLFNVYPLNEPEKSIKGPTASSAWIATLRSIDPKRKSVSGPAMYGLSHPPIRNLIEQLPNIEKCTSYAPTKKDKSVQPKNVNERSRTRGVSQDPEEEREGFSAEEDSDAETEMDSDDPETFLAANAASDLSETEMSEEEPETRKRRRKVGRADDSSEDYTTNSKRSKPGKPNIRDPNAKLRLPVAVGSIVVHSIGRVIRKPNYYTPGYIFPVGFKAVRSVKTESKGTVSVVSEVLEGKEGPLFHVYEENHPENGHTHVFPSGAWTAVRQAIDAKPGTANGLVMYGFTLPVVRHLIEQLPGAAEILSEMKSNDKEEVSTDRAEEDSPRPQRSAKKIKTEANSAKRDSAPSAPSSSSSSSSFSSSSSSSFLKPPRSRGQANATDPAQEPDLPRFSSDFAASVLSATSRSENMSREAAEAYIKKLQGGGPLILAQDSESSTLSGFFDEQS